MLRGGSKDEKLSALFAIGQLGQLSKGLVLEEAQSGLMSALLAKDEDSAVQCGAAEALAKLIPPSPVPVREAMSALDKALDINSN